MQQSGFNDMQLFQQNLIYKQIQELQRQQQLQHLGDNRLQNSVHQAAKQNPGAQFSPLINGVPVSDDQNMLRSRLQIVESAASRGSFDRSMLLQEQNSNLRSMNSSPQQFDASLCGTPISESRGSMNHLWNVQGSPESMNMFPKNESKGLMLASGMNNLYSDEQSAMQLELGMPDEAFASKQVYPEKGISNDYQMRGQGSFFTRNFQEDNSLQGSDSLPEFSGRQGEVGWHENKNSGLSQEMVPLDPLEAKILYNTDCSIWEAFGDPSTLATESFGNTFSNTGSSVQMQSGSWSALMQSAVAEASNIETTPQERWSGLSNTDTLNGFQSSTTLVSGKQKSEWEITNNLKPISALNDMNSFFPGFHCQDDESQKAQVPLHQGNSWATQAFKSDNSNKKNASSAFMKFEKGLQNENFHNSSELGNDSFRKRKDIYQTDNAISKGMTDQEPSHLEQAKLFANNQNNMTDIDKSPTSLAGDMRVSRDTFSSPRSDIGNPNRTMTSETCVDDPSTTSASRLSTQSPNYSGVNLSPSLHKQPNFKRSPSATVNMERANSLPREQWNEVSSYTSNLGSSSQWKSVPSSKDHSGPTLLPSDEKQYSIPHFNSEDSFPILEASTVRHPHLSPPSSHQNENFLNPLSLWRTKPQHQLCNTEPTKQSHQFPSFKGKSEPPVIQKDEIAQKQEMDSFTFLPVSRPHLPPLDTIPRFSNRAEYVPNSNAFKENAKCESSQAPESSLPNDDHTAPTLPWLVQYGSNKNGHVLPPERPHDDLTPSHEASASVIPPDCIKEPSVHPKKRKVEAPPRLPWRVEITHETTRIPSSSDAEEIWSTASRLFRKIENETRMYDDVPAHHRSKQRLRVVTQLTQTLFPPLPGAFFSTDFNSTGCDPLPYLAARASLGDSCSLLSSKEKKNSTDGEESTRQKRNRLEESMGSLLSRLKRMESELERLEKAGTLVDVKTEIQEVEKFAVINRFAKFHGRGPADVGMGMGRLNLQRYVTAFPLPSSLPQGVNCLPL